MMQPKITDSSRQNIPPNANILPNITKLLMTSIVIVGILPKSVGSGSTLFSFLIYYASAVSALTDGISLVAGHFTDSQRLFSRDCQFIHDLHPLSLQRCQAIPVLV